jgi:serine/threonine-protein kinase Chk1
VKRDSQDLKQRTVGYIAFEYCEGGELFSYIKTGYTREQNGLCHMIFTQILQALNFMHRQCGIAHLDIKLENMVVDGNFALKIIDFAFCEKID